MGRFDTFGLRIERPRALLIVNMLVHAVLAGLILQAIAAGLRPPLALWFACALVMLHMWHEHRALVSPERQLQIDAGRVQLSAEDGLCWQLRRVTCATRWLCIAELQRIAPPTRERHWLIVGGDQLCEADARRLLRWLRAGPQRESA